MKLLVIPSIALLFTSIGHARVGNMTFADLLKGSQAVVVGRVTRIDWVEGVRVATAEVSQSIKGSRKSVRFIAEATWACDTSDAVVGETALLCLTSFDARPYNTKRSLTGVFQLGHSGRGRIPLVLQNGVWTARVRRSKPGAQWELGTGLLAPKVALIGHGDTVGFMPLRTLADAAKPKSSGR